MGKRLTNEDQDGERLRHDKQPKASRVTFPANVLPFLRRSVKAEATITKLKRNTDGHECREAPEESSVVHCFQCDMASGRLPPPLRSRPKCISVGSDSTHSCRSHCNITYGVISHGICFGSFSTLTL